jgi:hypothetical protein
MIHQNMSPCKDDNDLKDVTITAQVNMHVRQQVPGANRQIGLLFAVHGTGNIHVSVDMP